MTEPAEPYLMVDVQFAAQDLKGREMPSSEQISNWANQAYKSVANEQNEVTVRLVDEPEMTMLNRDYRGKNSPTNVLSFEFEIDPEIDLALLGDIVICHAVVVKEAEAQNKQLEHHYAHLITHGILHLCGYDHEHEQQAREMEALEISLLENYGIANPYSH